jgi:hypothetical protein
MQEIKVVKCAVCGQPIKTTGGAAPMSHAPLVCRRCFGESSYASSSHWGYNPMLGGNTNS